MNCPNCGAVVNGNRCEYCGSTLSQENITINITNHYYGCQTPDDAPVPAPKSKRETAWWVLGWIFIFPIPLMVLLLKNKSMRPVFKILIIAAAWLLYILFVISGDTQQEPLRTACMLQKVML